ncbi:MAG: hypothetical protein B7Y77_03025, partial [Bradyrhizobium sp. 35-63-5]
VGGVSAPLGIAIPVMPTAEVANTAAGRTDVLGQQLAQIVSNDLRNSGLFKPLDAGVKSVAYPEVTAPTFDYWGPAGASALVQGSHAAYYSFASITWQNAGLGGLTIAALWSLGVIAEIAVFALSPRFTVSPAIIVAIGAAGAALRWLITAQEPPLAVLAAVQLMHGLSFGMTYIGTIGLLARSVPHHVLASAQGYLAASVGIVSGASMILSGLIYARAGQHVYYAMAMMALTGFVVMISVRARLDRAHAITA